MKKHCSLILTLTQSDGQWAWNITDRNEPIKSLKRLLPFPAKITPEELVSQFNQLTNNGNDDDVHLLLTWGKWACQKSLPISIVDILLHTEEGDVLFVVPPLWADVVFEAFAGPDERGFFSRWLQIGTCLTTELKNPVNSELDQSKKQAPIVVISGSGDPQEQIQWECNAIKKLVGKTGSDLHWIGNGDKNTISREIVNASVIYYAGVSDKNGWSLGQNNHFTTVDIDKLFNFPIHSKPRLVISNSCYGGRTGGCHLSGIASAFMKNDVLHVIGPSVRVDDRYAAEFGILFSTFFFDDWFKNDCYNPGFSLLKTRQQFIDKYPDTITPFLYRLFGDPLDKSHSPSVSQISDYRRRAWQHKIKMVTPVLLITVLSVFLLLKFYISGGSTDTAKNEFIESRSEGIHQLITQINKTIRFIESNDSTASNATNIVRYLNLIPLYAELEEFESTISSTGFKKPLRLEAYDSTGQAINNQIGIDDEPLLTRTQLSNRIDSMITVSINNIQDIARWLVATIDTQLPSQRLPMVIMPFTYHDTIVTPFSARLLELLKTQFVQDFNKQPIKQLKDLDTIRTSDLFKEQAFASGADWICNGHYWDEGTNVRITANVYEPKTGNVLAGTVLNFNTEILYKSGMSILPKDFKSAIDEATIFSKGKIVSNTLIVEAWTNKGRENVQFKKGDIMKLMLRVNQPSYIRAVYRLADGRYTLLVDNDTISVFQVNKSVMISREFECSEPFGVEQLIIIARTVPFEPLEFSNDDGYRIITSGIFSSSTGKIQKISAQVRGMKELILNRKANRKISFEQSETSIMITTLQ